MEFNEVINKRNSTRKFLNVAVPKNLIEKVLLAGLKAPSGKNGQPWKFIALQDDKALLKDISSLTIYDKFVKTADCLIAVFLDKTQSYNYIKDVQAIGASIENMLLAITDLGLSACWIGEILNRDLQVKKLLNLNNNLDLMAVIAVGYGSEKVHALEKKTLSECLIKWL